MKIIGLLGGVACGKSYVAKMFASSGAKIFDADCAGHDALKFPEVKAALRKRWGEDVFSPDGEVDRKKVARRVFEPSSAGVVERRFLESVVHPCIERAFADQASAAEAAGAPAIVLDAAILAEAGWKSLCDHIIYIEAPRPIRLERAKQRGWSESELVQREAAQLPIDEKKAMADAVIDNAGDAEATQRQVEAIWKEWISF